jgi:hypothetical protein
MVLRSVGILLVVLILLDHYIRTRVRQPCWGSVGIMTLTYPLPPVEMRHVLDAVVRRGKRLDGSRNQSFVRSTRLDDLATTIPELYKHYTSDRFLTMMRTTLDFPVALHPRHPPSLLLYADAADAIRWHYDHNFTRGRRFTAVFPLNVSSGNTSELQVCDCSGAVVTLSLEPGQGVVFDASSVYHRVTQQSAGAHRLVILVPLYDNPRQNALDIVRERLHLIVKSVALL